MGPLISKAIKIMIAIIMLKEDIITLGEREVVK
jgi:hypothetical protein